MDLYFFGFLLLVASLGVALVFKVMNYLIDRFLYYGILIAINVGVTLFIISYCSQREGGCSVDTSHYYQMYQEYIPTFYQILSTTRAWLEIAVQYLSDPLLVEKITKKLMKINQRL